MTKQVITDKYSVCIRWKVCAHKSFDKKKDTKKLIKIKSSYGQFNGIKIAWDYNS